MRKQRQSEFTKWMGPILDALRELGGSGTPREVSDKVAENLKIPDKVREVLNESGSPKFHNQVCWARQYLTWEGYLESSKRGIWLLSKEGERKRLSDSDAREIFLRWVAIYAQRRKSKKVQPDSDTNNQAVEIEEATQKLQDYKEELITVLRSLSPRGFEEFCLFLLRENGFDDLKLTEKSHDGGIDGISTLRINPFVSFKVLIQCKRYNCKNSISRAQIGDFRNAMLGRADKGIFMTTGFFSKDAEREANRDGVPPIELVDCDKLADMLVEKQLGVTQITTYEVDRGFFEKYRGI